MQVTKELIDEFEKEYPVPPYIWFDYDLDEYVDTKEGFAELVSTDEQNIRFEVWLKQREKVAALSPYEFSKGGDYTPKQNGTCNALAGIDVIENAECKEKLHGNRIEINVYGSAWTDDEALIKAQELRDIILATLQASQPQEQGE